MNDLFPYIQNTSRNSQGNISLKKIVLHKCSIDSVSPITTDTGIKRMVQFSEMT